MATVQFVEVDGRRVDITGLERTIETRCDGCGEYVAPEANAQVNITAFAGGVQRPGHFLEGHLPHVLEAARVQLAALEREYFQ